MIICPGLRREAVYQGVTPSEYGVNAASCAPSAVAGCEQFVTSMAIGAACDCTDTPTTNKPVCGGDLVTYGNECVAYCANVLIVSEGACPVGP